MSAASANGGSTAKPSSSLALKKIRLAEIHERYESEKMTPQQLHESTREGLRRMGVNLDLLEDWEEFGRSAGLAEDSRKIFNATFNYGSREITITSEGSRHWRKATEDDCGSIVFLTTWNEFGEFDDLDEEPDEEFPDDIHTTAIVYTFSGHQRTVWKYGCKFDDMLVVPKEVLEEVTDEAPPGRFFSGKSITDAQLRSTWSPAPNGETWVDHPFLAEQAPNGTYHPDEVSYYMNNMIDGNSSQIQEQLWKKRGALAYWCPVLKRFLSEGERLRQEHWFHNGDGSAQQRYFYDQNEMLDMHGGLGNLPLAISRHGGEINMQPFLGMDLEVLPHVMAWMAHGCTAERNSCDATPLYQFIRNLPMFIDFRRDEDSKPSPLTKRAKYDQA